MELEFPEGFTLGLQCEVVAPARRGRLPLFFATNNTGVFIVIVRTLQAHNFWGVITARVPRWNVDLQSNGLGETLLDGNALDGSTIWRRFDAKECEPLLFACLTREWLSEIQHEGPLDPHSLKTLRSLVDKYNISNY